MRLDGAKVAEARARGVPPGWRPQSQVMLELRPLCHAAGQPVPRASFLSAVERGQETDVPEALATALAAVLGVGLSEILDPGEHPDLVIAALSRELAEARDALNRIEGHMVAYLGLLKGREPTHV